MAGNVGKIYARLIHGIRYSPDETKLSFFDTNRKGDNLYIYYNFETMNKILNDTKKMWFKDIASYSDVLEHEYFKSKFFYVGLALEKKNYKQEFKDLFFKIFNELDENTFKGKFFILCTSYEPDNYLCWEGFTKSINEKKEINYGACICCNKSALDIDVESMITETSALYKGFVCYDKEEQTKIFMESLDNIYDLWSEGENRCNIEYFIRKIIILHSIFYKDHYYYPEKEYRYVIDYEQLKLLKSDVKINQINNCKYIEMEIHDSTIKHITIPSYSYKEIFKNYKLKLSKISLNNDGPKKMIYEG